MNRKALVILAGGKSSRMGRDKTFIEYKGSTFLLHLIRKAYSCFDRVLISAGSEEHCRQIRQFLEEHRNELMMPDNIGAVIPEIVIDGYEAIGPMGGLLSILEQTDLEAFALTAVDMPLADMKVLHYLLDRLDNMGASAKAGCDIAASAKDGSDISASAKAGVDPAASAKAGCIEKTSYKNGSVDNVSVTAGNKTLDSDNTGSEITAPEEQAGETKSGKAAVMLTFDGIHPEACAAAYSRRAYELFRPAYEAGEYSLFRALGKENVELLSCCEIPVCLHDPMNDEYLINSFKNYNTSADLEELK